MAIVDVDVEIIEPIPKIKANQDVMKMATDTLSKLNKKFNTKLGIKFVGIDYLRKHRNLKSSYQGFVIRSNPYFLYVVPENNLTLESVRKTTMHEFKHSLDLICVPNTINQGQDCPVNPSSAEREKRADAFENFVLTKDGVEIIGMATISDDEEEPILAKTTASEAYTEEALKGILKGEERARSKAMSVMRELLASEEHLIILRPDLTKKIRYLRKSLENKLWTGE